MLNLGAGSCFGCSDITVGFDVRGPVDKGFVDFRFCRRPPWPQPLRKASHGTFWGISLRNGLAGCRDWGGFWLFFLDGTQTSMVSIQIFESVKSTHKWDPSWNSPVAHDGNVFG